MQRHQRKTDAEALEKYKLAATKGDVDELDSLLRDNDPHLVDEEGRTILHIMAENDTTGNFLTELLKIDIVYPHTRTHAGQTPLDLAQKQLERHNLQPGERKNAKEVVKRLMELRCPQMKGSSEDLYNDLLSAITNQFNWEVIDLLQDGAPMELAGHRQSSALQHAIAEDHSRSVRVLLANGASLTHSSQGLNLLQQPWYSSNTSTKVHCAILTFACVPPNYDAVYRQLSQRGARVLALGRKELGRLTHAEVRVSLIQFLALHLAVSFMVDQLCLALLGEGTLAPSLRHSL